MGEWKKTSCTLCACTCGIEVLVENNRIVRVRGDKDNPKTEGYVCRKGRSIQYFQHQKDRTQYPLKRVGENEFVRISWEQAISEICGRLKEIIGVHGPRAFACQGLGGFYGSLHTIMAKMFMGAVGSQLHYRALAAELTGCFWSNGVMLGNQGFMPTADEESGEVLLACGWNPYVTHQVPQGKRVVREYATNPNKKFIVIDPRRTESARMADIHLPIRPGTDALLWRAMVALAIREDWVDKGYIEQYVSDYGKIVPWFADVDIKASCKTCMLDYDDVYEATRILAHSKSGLHSDLGVICGRHSTLTTHLQSIFLAITGNLLVKGGQVFSHTVIMLPHTDINDPKYWRTTVTDIPQIAALCPPTVLAEEIDNDHPERIRALFCLNSNPLHSVVDTTRHQEAFKKLDLLVTLDCAMTETARMSDYILPNATGYECYEMAAFGLTFPGIYAQLRQPVLEPEGEIMSSTEFWLRMLEEAGALPILPDSLYEAAKGPRPGYGKALAEFLEAHPRLAPLKLPIIVRTLGAALGAPEKALLWALLQTKDQAFCRECARAGFPEGPAQMEQVFQAILEHPQGLMIGYMDADELLDLLETEDKKIHLFAEELDEWVYEITPEREEKLLRNDEFPMVLSAGSHIEANINHTMRGHEWIRAKQDVCSVVIHPADAERLGIADGGMTRVTTDRGSVEIPARISRETRKGSVIIPHGFGFRYDGQVRGINVNVLTNVSNRDRFAATPYHRYVPCRVEVV